MEKAQEMMSQRELEKMELLKKKNLHEVEEETIDMKFFDDMKHVLFC